MYNISVCMFVYSHCKYFQFVNYILITIFLMKTYKPFLKKTFEYAIVGYDEIALHNHLLLNYEFGR